MNKKCVSRLKAARNYSQDDNIQNRGPYRTHENIMKKSLRNLEKIEKSEKRKHK